MFGAVSVSAARFVPSSGSCHPGIYYYRHVLFLILLGDWFLPTSNAKYVRKFFGDVNTTANLNHQSQTENKMAGSGTAKLAEHTWNEDCRMRCFVHEEKKLCQLETG
jgi:hypothetical protein